jgi:hypothetical protein
LLYVPEFDTHLSLSLIYSPSLVRRQCRRLAFHWMVFPVRIRIHWGSGRFWRCFLARVRLVRKDFWDGWITNQAPKRGRERDERA